MAGISFLATTPTSVNVNGVPSIVVSITSGQRGLPGVGLPAGGSTGQILVKRTGSDFQTEWADAPEGTDGSARWGKVLGTIDDQSDLKALLDDLRALIALKESIIATGQAGQYLTGAKTWADLTKAAVGLSNVENTADSAKPISAAQATAIAAKLDAAKVSTIALTLLDDATIADMRATLGLGSAATSATTAFAPATHTHAMSEISGLIAALAGKAATVHIHAISDVSGLQTALDGKASTSALSNLATKAEVAGKANAVHTHAIGDVDGLEAALDDRVTETQLAEGLDTKQPLGSYATLDSTGKVPLSQLPPLGDGGQLGVFTVNGRDGDVLLEPIDVQLDQVNNTSDLDKPVSLAMQDALNEKLNIVDLPPPVDTSMFATQAELSQKADQGHTHGINEVNGLDMALEGKQDVGDYATNTQLAAGLATKADTNHTHPDKLDASAYVKGLSIFCGGKPVASEVIGGSVAPYAFTISANSIAKAGTSATASTVFTIRKGGTAIGTLTFNAGATTAVPSITSGAVAINDFITITAPTTPDATLANIAFTLR